MVPFNFFKHHKAFRTNGQQEGKSPSISTTLSMLYGMAEWVLILKEWSQATIGTSYG